SVLLSSTIRRPLTPTLFPYTTLFRSRSPRRLRQRGSDEVHDGGRCGEHRRAEQEGGQDHGRQPRRAERDGRRDAYDQPCGGERRSEEHTSELQSPYDLVCRLLLEKKN